MKLSINTCQKSYIEVIGIYGPLPEVVIKQPFYGILITLSMEWHIVSDQSQWSKIRGRGEERSLDYRAQCTDVPELDML